MKIKDTIFNTFSCPVCEKNNKSGLLEFNAENYSWTCSTCNKKYKNVNSKTVVKPLIRKYYPKKSILVTERDLLIEKFLDRVGWGNYEQILKYLELNSYSLSLSVLRTRLCLLVKFGRLRSERTLTTTYFALTKTSKKESELVGVFSHDRLKHDNFLVDIFLDNFQHYEFLTPREIKSQSIVGKKTGPIPDLVVLDNNGNDDVYLEYERTPKSTNDISTSIYNWLWSIRRREKGNGSESVIVICENDEIYNKYVSISAGYNSLKYKEINKYNNLKIINSFDSGRERELMLLIIKKDKFSLDVCYRALVDLWNSKVELDQKIEQRLSKK